MSRMALVFLIFAVMLDVSCGDSSSGSQAAPGPSRRVDAVKATKQTVSLDAFCDVRASLAKAPSFVLPALAEPVDTTARGWRWTNVWATWCKPCIEEMPRLSKWQERFAQEGIAITLEYLSVDTSEETVQRFREKHPSIPASLRIQEFGMLQDWFESIGLDAGATIPIHVFSNADGKVRCVRTGAVDEPDYATIKALIQAG